MKYRNAMKLALMAMLLVATNANAQSLSDLFNKSNLEKVVRSEERRVGKEC